MKVGAHAVRPSLTGLMITLTAVTGLIEAVSLLALGPVFTAIQTGNVLFLAFGLAREGNLPALSRSPWRRSPPTPCSGPAGVGGGGPQPALGRARPVRRGRNGTWRRGTGIRPARTWR
ncbi:DUF1275 domain-containing protein [Streptomyces sp. ISL-94]|nr:DUF1275 domain-containing protein [Streptomyces sp. ISL-94]